MPGGCRMCGYDAAHAASLVVPSSAGAARHRGGDVVWSSGACRTTVAYGEIPRRDILHVRAMAPPLGALS